MRSSHKIFSDKFLSKLLLKKLNVIKKNNFLNFSRLFVSGIFDNLLYREFYSNLFQYKLKDKKVLNYKKLKARVRLKSRVNLLSNLTKKQKKRVRVTRLHKLIRPSSPTFLNFKRYPRNSLINSICLNQQVLIHDGYSWHLFLLSRFFLNYTAGFLCFKTRVLSPIDLFLKGKTKLKMAQKNTFKIKTIKVKRKK